MKSIGNRVNPVRAALKIFVYCQNPHKTNEDPMNRVFVFSLNVLFFVLTCCTSAKTLYSFIFILIKLANITNICLVIFQCTTFVNSISLVRK